MAIKIRFAEETIAIFTSSRPIQRTDEKFSSLQMSQIIVAENAFPNTTSNSAFRLDFLKSPSSCGKSTFRYVV